ncbi:hypothetical protein CQZ93_07650 [Ochrobactrum vermis]|nr:hypothetical protein CQZ93_07650 [Ochrobactrum vermis]
MPLKIVIPIIETDNMAPERIPMKHVAILISLAVLAGCGGASKAAMDTGKSFDRFACMSRNFKGEPPCPQPEATNQSAQ